MGKNWRRGGLVNRQVFPRPILLQEFVVRISFLSHSTTNTFICVYVYFFFKLYWQQQYFFPTAQMIAAKKKEYPGPNRTLFHLRPGQKHDFLEVTT